MLLYAKKSRNLIKEFELWEITQISRAMNEETGALAKVTAQGSTSDSIPVILVQHSSIEECDLFFQKNREVSWQTPIEQYLKYGTLPNYNGEAQNLKFWVAQNTIEGDILQKRLHKSTLQMFRREWSVCKLRNPRSKFRKSHRSRGASPENPQTRSMLADP